MITRFTRAASRFRLNLVARRIVDTPPLDMTPSDLRFVTMLRHRDVVPYLLAIKSVYPRFGEGSAIVVDDGSLREADLSLIRRHVPLIEFRELVDGALDGLPRGGTWERLGTIMREMPERYVIQIDSDILCRGPIGEAVQAYRDNRPFALSNAKRPGHVTLGEMTDWVKSQGWPPKHIQVLAELTLGTLSFEGERRYVRATSAFAGFPKGHAMAGELKSFSEQMWQRLGARWTEWGSEQVASNFVVANRGAPLELVPPKYANFSPDADQSGAELLHFYGTHRYEKGVYARYARQAVRAYAGSRA